MVYFFKPSWKWSIFFPILQIQYLDWALIVQGKTKILNMPAFFIKRSFFIDLIIRGNYERFRALPCSHLKKGFIILQMEKVMGSDSSVFDFEEAKVYFRIKMSRTSWLFLLPWWLVVQALDKLTPSDPWVGLLDTSYTHPPCHREGQPQSRAGLTQSPKFYLLSSSNSLQMSVFLITLW